MRSNKQIAALVQTALVTAALTAGIMTAAPMFRQTLQIDNPDWPLRSSEIHWPARHTPADADLFAHNELPDPRILPDRLATSRSRPDLARLVSKLTQCEALLNSPDVRLHQATQFSWDTFGVHIESQVHEFGPTSRIGWFGQGTGMEAYHTFLLLKTPEGCRVVTEEVVRGPGAVEFRKKDPNAMHRGHDLWLSALKQVSEK